jgi:hypothetical protein
MKVTITPLTVHPNDPESPPNKKIWISRRTKGVLVGTSNTTGNVSNEYECRIYTYMCAW